VRYLGFELGANSHRPHPPEWVLARRFGDCKDKSLLLVALLEGLGLRAEPALVNTRTQAGLDGWLPTPLAFDHVIVRAQVEGREVWVDPTRTLERGGLEGREPPAFGRALMVSPDATALVPIPEPAPREPQVDVEEHYEAKEEGGPATLEVVTRYRGGEADRMRRHTATTPLADVARDALNFYARRDARIRPQGELRVEDDAERNVLTVTERYVIEDFWDEQDARHFWAWPIEEQLPSPQIAQRTQPLAVPHPVDVRYAVRLTLPHPPDVAPDRREVQSAAFRFDAHVRSEGRQLRLDYRLRSRQGQLTPEAVPAHLEDLRRVRELLGFETSFPKPDEGWDLSALVPTERSLATGGLVFVVSALVFLALSLLVANRLALRARLEAQVQVAPVPASALEASPVQDGTVQDGTVQDGTVQDGTVQDGTVHAGPRQAGAAQVAPVVEATLLQPPPPRPVLPAAPLSLQAPEAGSAPAHALAVADEAALRAHLDRQVCACGAGLADAASQAWGEPLRMGQREISPVALRCGACGRERWLYFAVGPAGGGPHGA
jgi:hypothetical protein